MAESPVFRLPSEGFLGKFIGESTYAEVKVIRDRELPGDVRFEG
jgi:hypothetical protein